MKTIKVCGNPICAAPSDLTPVKGLDEAMATAHEWLTINPNIRIDYIVNGKVVGWFQRPDFIACPGQVQ